MLNHGKFALVSSEANAPPIRIEVSCFVADLAQSSFRVAYRNGQVINSQSLY
jgi:hypothetical protein